MWLNDRMPTKALLDLTRPIRELKHITSVVNDGINDEDGTLNENLNDDHMDQDDVRAYLHFEYLIYLYNKMKPKSIIHIIFIHWV